MRATRRLEPCRVICFIEEIVVAFRVRAKFRIVMKRAQRQRRTAAPASHHLCCEKFLVLRTDRVRLEKFAKLGYALVQLAEDYVRAVASEEFRRSLLNATHLVRITEHELACLEWLLPEIGPRNSTPFDCRMADAIAESERFFLIR